jgi:shikimate 5-dehydrogenase
MTTQYVAVFGDPVEGNPTSIMQNAAFEHAGRTGATSTSGCARRT